jgi:hypothetical protein
MASYPDPLTVHDVWRLRGDPARLSGAAAALRHLAAELDAAAGLLRRGQEGLGQVLERLDVPAVYAHGSVTFYPHDEHDVAAVRAAVRCAAAIHAALRSSDCR